MFEGQPMFMEVNLGLTNIYLARLANWSDPAGACKSVLYTIQGETYMLVHPISAGFTLDLV